MLIAQAVAPWAELNIFRERLSAAHRTRAGSGLAMSGLYRKLRGRAVEARRSATRVVKDDERYMVC